MAAIAPRFPGVEAINRVGVASGTGVFPSEVCGGQWGWRCPSMAREPGMAWTPQGTGCHLEGQASLCGGAPTPLERSYLNLCFGFFCCCCCSKRSPALWLGRGWWQGTGRPLVEPSPMQTPWGTQREPFCGAGGRPARGGPAPLLLARPRPSVLGLRHHPPSAWPLRPCGAVESLWGRAQEQGCVPLPARPPFPEGLQPSPGACFPLSAAKPSGAP